MFKRPSPEQLKARRLEREASAAKEQTDRDIAERVMAAGILIVSGFLLLVVGLWFLVFAPNQDVTGFRTVVNLQRLYIGQTAAIVGAIFFATGLHLRNSS
jgi:hypothetical protein